MRVFLSLGSNLGDRRANIASALALLRRAGRVEKISPLYETEPMYLAGQPRFYNAAAQLETRLSPEDLLASTAGVEKELKRRRTRPNGPRTMDIDILFYGNGIIGSPDLAVPHPGLAERAFVLFPLADIAPDFIHPVLGKSVLSLKRSCPGAAGVRRLPERYAEALDWLYALKPSSRKNYGPAAEKKMLRALGDPQEDYPCAHVAGSNGKTSTSMLLARALTASGYRTGLYISPHVSDPRERISVDGEKIGRGEFFRLFRKVSSFGAELSFFEFLTAMAFLHFSRKNAEIAVIEAGLGGRLDATSVMTPAAAVITGVSMEHSDLLGGDLTRIARHKAGIIKKGTVAVVNAGGPALAAVSRRAKALGVPLFRVARQAACRGVSGYQAENLETAAEAARVLSRRGFCVTRRALERAAAGFAPPGRFEERRVRGRTVVFDGAHNPAALERFFSALLVRYPGRRVLCVAGVMRDKDARGLAGIFGANCGLVILTRPSSYRAAEPETLAAYLSPQTARIIKDPARAFKTALESAGPGDILAVCGSFYLISDIKAHLAGRKASFPREMIV
ncbi:MAG: 2-amino-4-hydroxy-6-hydroxymethyldihydropteridine diphosphokinase [Elusimicrobiales bacterium]|jgi:dihydrofolate synthase/folylpolyglutamate synthase